ncbi:MAG TPA: hypothetical protein VFZ65_01200 [Planctomycetota bacterium]|nr:hypothetical protein [Planctomycetota bacterium]
MLHHLLPAALLGAACAPVFAQSPGLRVPLQAWLAHQKHAAQYEDWFVPFRKAVLLAKSTKCTLVPNGGTDAPLYDVLAAIGPLDDGMETFAAGHARELPATGVANLLDLAAAFRANGDSLEPLLPWLLLVHERSGPDARVELCLFEAWGTDALDCSASKAAAQRLKELDEAPLRAFLCEAKAIPAGKPGTVQRLVDQLCAGKLDQGAPLGSGALGRALVAEIEQDYELAMQLGDFARAASCLETMLLANPRDFSAQLLLEASGGQTKGERFEDRYKDASPDERAAIDARLQHLGLAIVAPGSSVAAVVQAVRDGALDFFRNDLGDPGKKKLDAAIKTSEKALATRLGAVKNLRDDIAELERKIKKYERIVGMRREVRDWRQRIDDKKAEIDKLDAEAAKELETKTRLEAERQDLQARIDDVKKRRSGFQLQPAPGEPVPREPEPEPEEARAAAAGQPLAEAPLPPPEPPAGQPPVAPPSADFDLALPQARELRQATADLDSGRFEQARTAFHSVKGALARVPADATTRQMIAVASYRLGESRQRLALQKARVTRNDVDAQILLIDADREFARLRGPDFATAREGSSLHAAALRSRLQIHSTLYCGYRELATANPRDQTYRTKCDAHAKTANGLLDELKTSFATATLPDGRRIAEVAREEAAAALR